MNHWMKLGLTAAAASLALAGCQRGDSERAPPPPAAETQPGTGGSGDEGTTSEKLGTEPGEAEVLPDTSDEPRPDERPSLRPDPAGTGGAGGAGMGMDGGMGGAGDEGTGGELLDPATGGSGTEGEERTEGGTGTEELQPGEVDAKTGQPGTGGAGAVGDPDAGGFDSADGVGDENGTTY